MNGNDPTAQLARRPLRYWFEDGLGELLSAVLFGLIGGSFWIQGTATQPVVKTLAGLFGFILIGGGVWLMRPILHNLKERITYPRTGYVSYHKPSPNRRRLVAILGMLVAICVATFFTRAGDTFTWLPIFEGVTIGGFFFYQGYQTNLPRLMLLGAVSALIGAWLSAQGIGDLLGIGIYFTLIGLAQLISGSWALWCYLRSAPPISINEIDD